MKPPTHSIPSIALFSKAIQPNQNKNTKQKDNLQRDVTNGDIKSVKKREHEHDHILPFSKSGGGEISKTSHGQGTESRAQGMNSCEGPGEGEVEGRENGLVVDGEGEV